MNDEELKRYYYNPSRPGSYAGSENFLRALKSQKIEHDPTAVREWLKKEETYTLHRPLRRKFKRNKVIVTGIDDTWQCDLVDMQKHAKFNDKYRYILTCIDVFSKFAWGVPVRTKTSKDVTLAFAEILKSNRSPKHLQADKGNEFINKDFKKLLSENNIKFYSVQSDLKACVIERFNRTLKEKMYRRFTYKNNYKYIEILPELIESYNKSYHRTIKMAPNDVTKEKEKKLWRQMYGYDEKYLNKDKIKFQYEVDDTVRISKTKGTFEKGYTPNWTIEIFKITQRLPRVPPVYRIKDLLDDEIDGIFYEAELQKVFHDEVEFLVDKVLKSRTRNGVVEKFVSWLGYPDKFNSWVLETEIRRL
jgi:transposase InsO family protein